MGFVTLLDELLEFLRRSSPGLHLCGIKEDPHLCLAAGFIKRNRVENIVSILRQRLRSPERIITGTCNKRVKPIRTLPRDFKALVGI